MKRADSVKEFIRENKEKDVVSLLLSKQKLLTKAELKFAVQQIQGLQSIKYKLPRWYANESVLYPVHLSLEQCSSELTAEYKRDLLSGYSLIDLTGGFGVDTTYLADSFEQIVYVEQNKALSEIAQNNFHAFALNNIEVICGTTESVIKEIDQVDTIYIDPARRDSSGGKLISITECEPNVVQLQSQFRAKSKNVLIKLSPMLDIKQALRELDSIKEIHVVAVNNECKELLLYIDYAYKGEGPLVLHCVNLTLNKKSVFSFSLDEESIEALYTQDLKSYLYEPNAAILKGGAYNSISHRYRLEKLHPNSHLYTSDRDITDFPGRRFQVVRVFSFSKSSLKALRKLTAQANITIRNFPISVAGLRKKLKLADGGDVYIFATTLLNGERVLIACVKA